MMLAILILSCFLATYVTGLPQYDDVSEEEVTSDYEYTEASIKNDPYAPIAELTKAFEFEVSQGLGDLETSKITTPFFAFFTDSSTPESTYKFEDSLNLLKNPKFNKNKKTVIYAHGYLNSELSESVLRVVKAYQQIKAHNIIVLDWSVYTAHYDYRISLRNIEKAGRHAASAVYELIKKGLSLKYLHLVGFSLGAHLVGMIGRGVMEMSHGKFKLKRITALDPAHPGFYMRKVLPAISATDAEFVDVIHTNKNLLGAAVSTGTVDFWPNGANMQNGCFLHQPGCSHSRAWMYWAESLTAHSDHQFNAIQAESWEAFTKGKKGKYDPRAVMGIKCFPGLKGNYYLVTNSKSPFARGKAGTSYKFNASENHTGLYEMPSH